MKSHFFQDHYKKPLLTDEELNKNLIAFLEKELTTFRLYPLLIDLKIRESKLPNDIIKKITLLINKNLEEIDELIDTHHSLTSKYNKMMFRYLTESYIQEIILDEYKMILSVKEYASTKNSIEGKYLKYNLDNSGLKLLEQSTFELINGYARTLRLFLSLYKGNNSRWLEEFTALNRELEKNKNENQIETQLQDVNPYLLEAYKYYKECNSSHQKATVTGLSKRFNKPRQTFVDSLGTDLHTKIKQMFKKRATTKK